MAKMFDVLSVWNVITSTHNMRPTMSIHAKNKIIYNGSYGWAHSCRRHTLTVERFRGESKIERKRHPTVSHIFSMIFKLQVIIMVIPYEAVFCACKQNTLDQWKPTSLLSTVQHQTGRAISRQTVYKPMNADQLYARRSTTCVPRINSHRRSKSYSTFSYDRISSRC